MSTADSKTTAASIARTVILNGKRHSSRATTLAELLVESGYVEGRIATALNGEFVPERKRATTTIADGDRIEVVSPRQGG